MPFPFILSAMISLSLTQPAQAQPPTRLEFAPINHLFVPSGFDDNDTAELVVTGYLPNPCYQRPESRVRIAGNTILVRVSTAHTPGSSNRQTLCPDVVVPFTETIKVGYLATGQYKIVVNDTSSTKQLGSIKVTPSTISSVDEYPYAIVNYIDQDPKDMKYYLHGSIYSDCFKLESVQYVSNNKDVVAVLPIMKQVASHCALKITHFKTLLNPPLDSLSSPYFLLHVRSADGKSVNFVGSKK